VPRGRWFQALLFPHSKFEDAGRSNGRRGCAALPRGPGRRFLLRQVRKWLGLGLAPPPHAGARGAGNHTGNPARALVPTAKGPSGRCKTRCSTAPRTGTLVVFAGGGGGRLGTGTDDSSGGGEGPGIGRAGGAERQGPEGRGRRIPGVLGRRTETRTASSSRGPMSAFPHPSLSLSPSSIFPFITFFPTPKLSHSDPNPPTTYALPRVPPYPLLSERIIQQVLPRPGKGAGLIRIPKVHARGPDRRPALFLGDPQNNLRTPGESLALDTPKVRKPFTEGEPAGGWPPSETRHPRPIAADRRGGRPGPASFLVFVRYWALPRPGSSTAPWAEKGRPNSLTVRLCWSGRGNRPGAL